MKTSVLVSVALFMSSGYLACKTGSVSCDDSLLTRSEVKEIADVRRQRDALACEVGDFSCDRSLLSAGKAPQNAGDSSPTLRPAAGGADGERRPSCRWRFLLQRGLVPRQLALSPMRGSEDSIK